MPEDLVEALAPVVLDMGGDTLKRYEWAMTIGLPVQLAQHVAGEESCDLHRVHELLKCSCPPELAVSLATPVRG